jgi:hypothetical protein
VIEESDAAVDGSLRSARIVARRSPPEWIALLVAGAVVAVLVTVPSLSSRGGRSSSASLSTPQLSGGHATGAARRASKHTKAPLPGASTKTIPQVPINVPPAGSNSKLGNGPNGAPYAGGGTAHYSKQLASLGLAAPKNAGAKAISAPGGDGGAASSSGGGSATHTSSGAPPAGGHSLSAGGLSAPGASSNASQSGSQSAKGGLAPGRKGAAAGTGRGSNGGARGSGAPPGGESAGRVAGSNQLSAGLVPDLPSGTAGLPLQAGYAPSAAKQTSGQEGVSQTPNGGGGAARSAHTNDQGSNSGTEFAVIPPTPNSSTTIDQGLLYSYFGSADQLRFGGW